MKETHFQKEHVYGIDLFLEKTCFQFDCVVGRYAFPEDSYLSAHLREIRNCTCVLKSSRKLI